MPTILVKIPHGSFPGESRAVLVHKINQAAVAAEQLSDTPHARAMCWVLVDELAAGAWTCGGADLSAQILPCAVFACVPGGVLDETSRGLFAAGIHTAFKDAMPPGEQRRLATSMVIHEVPDGAWRVGGDIWRLPDFARVAGYAHLQHLNQEEPSHGSNQRS